VTLRGRFVVYGHVRRHPPVTGLIGLDEVVDTGPPRRSGHLRVEEVRNKNHVPRVRELLRDVEAVELSFHQHFRLHRRRASSQQQHQRKPDHEQRRHE